MVGVIKYTLMFIGGVAVILFIIGMVFTAFHTEHIDYVEKALEEVTRKRRRK
jgi:succinate dehydrogenase hydrophobic anchor subunit